MFIKVENRTCEDTHAKTEGTTNVGKNTMFEFKHKEGTSPLDNLDIDSLLDPDADKIPAPPPKAGMTVVPPDVVKTPEQVAEEARLAAEATAAEKAKLIATGGNADTVLTDPQAVEIDNVKYALDKDGNALSEDGKVFKTKAELDALETPEIPVVNEFISRIGISPVDEKGVPVQYEDSIDGMIQAAIDVANVKLKESQRNLFKAYPKGEAYIKHIAAGGTDEEFFNVLRDDYSGVTIDDANTDQQKHILTQFFLKKGLTPEKATKQVKLLTDANDLLPESKDALVALQKMQKDLQLAKAEEAKALEDKETSDTRDYWNGVGQTVKTGKLNLQNKDGSTYTVVIPEAVREQFFDYMAKSVDQNGNSQAMIDSAKEDTNTKIYLDLLRYLKYDLSKLIKEGVATAQVKSLRDRISKEKAKGGAAIPGVIPKKGDATNVSVDDLY